jgi:hypothetical protein
MSDQLATRPFIDDAPDVTSSTGIASVLQVNSRHVLGEGRIAGASGGDIYVPFAAGPEVFSGAEGFLAEPVFFHTRHVVWKDRSGGASGSGPVATFFGKPPEARWGTNARGRAAMIMPNGDIVRETVNANVLVDGRPAILPFAAPAHKDGAAFSQQAARVKTNIDGDSMQTVGSTFRITTYLTNNDNNEKWYALRFKLESQYGAYGELGKHAPTMEAMREAKALRIQFLLAEERARKEWNAEQAQSKAAERAAIAATPPLQARPSRMTITTGIQRGEVADSVRARRPDLARDPLFDDEIPF